MDKHSRRNGGLSTVQRADRKREEKVYVARRNHSLSLSNLGENRPGKLGRFYTRFTRQADQGCDLDFLEAGEVTSALAID
jgi:hypothetical protein